MPRAKQMSAGRSSRNHDVLLGADRAQTLEPLGIGVLVAMCVARAVDQRRVRRRGRVRMQRLQRIDEHAGDVASRPQDAQRIVRHVLECVGLVCRQWVADTRLHVAPPAMIGAAEAHQVGPAGVVARQPHGLHHRLGARHMERHFVESGKLFQTLHVVGDDRMIRAEHRAKLADALDGASYRLLVEVVAEDIDPVGAGQVVELIAVEIREHDARGRLHERCGFEVLAHDAAILERHPIGVGELQIGDAIGRLGGAADRFGKARVIERRQPLEAGAAAPRDLLRRIVGTEEPALVVVVERHQRGHPPRHPGMAGQRPVLGLRKLEPPAQCHQRRCQRGSAKPVECQCRAGPFHRIVPYPKEVTAR